MLISVSVLLFICGSLVKVWSNNAENSDPNPKCEISENTVTITFCPHRHISEADLKLGCAELCTNRGIFNV